MLRGLALAILLASVPTPTPSMSVDNLLAAASVRARLAEPGGPITTIRVEADFVTCTQ